MILERIDASAQLEHCTYQELNELAAELRGELIGRVSENGGHLASSLGALDSDLILDLGRRIRKIVAIEEDTLEGGFGEGVLRVLGGAGAGDTRVECVGLPDKFVERGPQDVLGADSGLDAAGIARRAKRLFPEFRDAAGGMRWGGAAR